MRTRLYFILFPISVLLPLTPLLFQAGAGARTLDRQNREKWPMPAHELPQSRLPVPDEERRQSLIVSPPASDIVAVADFRATATQGFLEQLFGAAPARRQYRKRSRRRRFPGARRVGRRLSANQSPIPARLRRKKRRKPGLYGRTGSFRTVCVRLCDGYYWPIDHDARGSQLRRDQRICKNRCGAPSRMFYLHNRSDDTAHMRDLRGNLYKNLKNAFLYRKKYVSSCRCRPDPWTPEAQSYFKRRAERARTRRLASLKRRTRRHIKHKRKHRRHRRSRRR